MHCASFKFQRAQVKKMPSSKKCVREHTISLKIQRSEVSMFLEFQLGSLAHWNSLAMNFRKLLTLARILMNLPKHWGQISRKNNAPNCWMNRKFSCFVYLDVLSMYCLYTYSIGESWVTDPEFIWKTFVKSGRGNDRLLAAPSSLTRTSSSRNLIHCQKCLLYIIDP